uniref:Uncharacterized protein n=1 Tax=Romanomermis culicivorax TaxID=13658 RepID=A0A915J621_ROMCU
MAKRVLATFAKWRKRTCEKKHGPDAFTTFFSHVVPILKRSSAGKCFSKQKLLILGEILPIFKQ